MTPIPSPAQCSYISVAMTKLKFPSQLTSAAGCPRMYVKGFLVLWLLLHYAVGRYELGPFNPMADAKAVVVSGSARFTVLTKHLIRCEFSGSKTDVFEDRATLAFINRRLPVPPFTLSRNETLVEISTEALVLSYRVGHAFSPASLSIRSRAGVFDWKFGDSRGANLLGTIRSLDELGVIPLNCTENSHVMVHKEQLHCSWGLISRDGWAAVEDTDSYGLNGTTSWWESPNTDLVDMYFFGHGLDFKQALYDFSLVSGPSPMPLRGSLGMMRSRWFNFNDNQVRKVVNQYEIHNLPLDVWIFDMDWHFKANVWGGYTWDSHLFPIPESTTSFLHSKGLLVSGNLHDNSGIWPQEVTFANVSVALGLDPNASKPIPFDSCRSMEYAYALEDITLAAAEQTGIGDFWWIDWQQGGTKGGCAGGKMNPTIWLNRLRATDTLRRGGSAKDVKRGMVLARWGGLGSHRYPIGFSGDVKAITWQNLAFQPYFSLTASNVLFSWSHDVVGPNGLDHADHELHVRWVQWSAFSSFMRTHDRGKGEGLCSDWPFEDCSLVEIYQSPLRYFTPMRVAVRQRAELIPYLYTAQRQLFDFGISVLRPMYYDHPNEEMAYAATPSGEFAQYMWGDDILVAPVVTPGDSATLLASKSVWIPPGCWIDTVRAQLTSPGTHSNSYDLTEIPRWVRANKIIPTVPLPHQAQDLLQDLVLELYPSFSSDCLGETEAWLYEDDGGTTAYFDSDMFTRTMMSVHAERENAAIEVTVHPYSGSFPTRNRPRNYLLRIYNYPPPSHISLSGATWVYNAELMALEINCPPSTDGTLQISIQSELFPLLDTISSMSARMRRAQLAKEALDQTWATPGALLPSNALLSVVASLPQQLSWQASRNVHAFRRLVEAFPDLYQSAQSEIVSLKYDPLAFQQWIRAVTLLKL